MIQEGPLQRILYSCHGCKYLWLEDWEFYGENDDVDRGTDAKCLKENKNITSYWYKSNHTPTWCPYLQKGMTNEL